MRSIEVWDCPHPLSAEGRRHHAFALDTPASLAQLKSWAGIFQDRPIAFVNGMCVDSEHVVYPGDIVSFHVEPRVSTITAWLIMELSFSYFVAAFVAQALVAITVNALISTVFGADSPSGTDVDFSDSPNPYSVSSANNPVRGYQPMLVCMGNMRYSPDTDARPWSQFVEDPENSVGSTTTSTQNQLFVGYWSPSRPEALDYWQFNGESCVMNGPIVDETAQLHDSLAQCEYWNAPPIASYWAFANGGCFFNPAIPPGAPTYATQQLCLTAQLPPPPPVDYWAFTSGVCQLNPAIVGGTPTYATEAACIAANP